MPHDVYLVFSEKPEHISDADYHAWYAHHAQENVESTGFVNAQRYRVREVAAGEPTGPELHLARYEFEPPMSTWRTDLNGRIERGEVVLPEWFGEITFRSWTCTPVGDLLLPHR
jgi:hypothetical protein